MVLDTGSSDLWVATSACKSCGDASTPLFNTGASSSYAESSQQTPIQITYGSGDVSGTLASETVVLGGFQVTQQQFGAHPPPLSPSRKSLTLRGAPSQSRWTRSRTGC